MTRTAPAPVASAPVVGYIVYHRAEAPRSRWRKVAEVRTYNDAVALMRGAGSWWAAEIRDPKLLRPETRQPTLFD